MTEENKDLELDFEIGTNEIKCPYCKNGIDDEIHGYNVNQIVECGECGKKYRIGEKDYEVTFWTYKIEPQPIPKQKIEVVDDVKICG